MIFKVLVMLINSASSALRVSLWLFIGLLMVANSLSAQNKTIKPGTDTVLINSLNDEAFKMLSSDPKAAKENALVAMKLSDAGHFLKGKDKANLVLGLLHYYQGDYKSALVFLDTALAIRRRRHDVAGEASALNNIGLVYYGQGNYSKALDYFVPAQKLSEQVNNLRLRGSALLNIGNVYDKAEVPAKAEKYYKDAEAILRMANDEAGLAGCLLSLGNVYKNRKKYDLALKSDTQALEMFRKLDDHVWIAASLNNIGDVYKHQGQLDKSLNYFLESLHIKQQIGDRPGMCVTLRGLAEVWGRKGNLVIAIVYAEESRDLAFRIGANELLRDAYRSLAELHERAGNLSQAFRDVKRYIEITENTIGSRSMEKLAEMESKSEIAERESKIKLLEKDKALQALHLKQNQTLIEKNNQFRNWSMVAITLITIIVIIMLNSIRLQRQANRMMEQKSAEILMQRDDLEQKNRVINNQIVLVQQKNKEITDSINYARRIQATLLPPPERFREHFKEHFIFYQPRDIVSGDFYWFTQIGQQLILAVGDCVGHGVPGAFMTVMGCALLNEIVIENNLTDPGLITEELDKKVFSSLRSQVTDPDARGEMDIAVLNFDRQNNTFSFSGARSSIYKVHNREVQQIKGDKYSIGSQMIGTDKFNVQTIPYQSGDMLYLSTDGFADQFGGTYLKKFMTKNFRSVLENISHEKGNDQRLLLENEFFAWKGNAPQTDDVLVIGVRL